MINILLSILFSIFSLQIFTINYKFSVFSKTLLNIPMSIFEMSIPTDRIPTVNRLYYDKKMLQKYVNEYFDDNISDLCGDYQLLYFYFSTDDNLYCKTSYCDGVRITLSAYVFMGIKYENTMSYYIKENVNE